MEDTFKSSLELFDEEIVDLEKELQPTYTPVFKEFNPFKDMNKNVELYLQNDRNVYITFRSLCTKYVDSYQNLLKIDNDANLLRDLIMKLYLDFGNDINLNWIDDSLWEVMGTVDQSILEAQTNTKGFKDLQVKVFDEVFNCLENGGSVNDKLRRDIIKAFCDIKWQYNYKFRVKDKKQLYTLIKKVYEICGDSTDVSFIDMSNWRRIGMA